MDGSTVPTAESASASTNSSPAPKSKRTPNDYYFGKSIGEGSFSTVYLAKDIHTNKEYAIKVCDKRHILREKKEKLVVQERDVMNLLNTNADKNCPFFVELYATFQDTQSLYFVLSYAKCGELLTHIKSVSCFDYTCTQFYAAEIVHALAKLHKLGIIHRDLKPENILLDARRHIKITDFGSAKLLKKKVESSDDSQKTDSQKRRNSFVGSAAYVSPEVLVDRPVSGASDLWALGCIIFQMTAGQLPFSSKSEYLVFKKIQKLEYEFPEGFNSVIEDLVKQLLVLEPCDRLGAKDEENYPSLKAHSFFKDVSFETLYLMEPPPINPYLPPTPSNEELRSSISRDQPLRPGLDSNQVALAITGINLSPSTAITLSPTTAPPTRRRSRTSLMDFTAEEKQRRLEEQARDNSYHEFVENNLILKQGLIDKRKGLFARRRMFLLTTGPHLYYVDPVNRVLKGQIPWSEHLRPEPKNFKIFFVHTPNRTYYLEDPEKYALEWCRAIEEVYRHTYGVS